MQDVIKCAFHTVRKGERADWQALGAPPPGDDGRLARPMASGAVLGGGGGVLRPLCLHLPAPPCGSDRRQRALLPAVLPDGTGPVGPQSAAAGGAAAAGCACDPGADHSGGAPRSLQRQCSRFYGQKFWYSPRQQWYQANPDARVGLERSLPPPASRCVIHGQPGRQPPACHSQEVPPGSAAETDPSFCASHAL